MSVIANTLSLLVMTMKHNRHLSTCVYMGIIAINDSIYLTLSFEKWFSVNTSLLKTSDLLCKLIIYLDHVFGTFGAFEIVLMTLDKVIAIKIPHKSALLCTAKRAILLSVINFFIMVVFYLPFLDFSKAIGNDGCARYMKKDWYVTIYSYLSLAMNPITPVIMLLIMNSFTIRAVWKSKRMRSGNQTGDQTKTKSTEVQLTVMLILVSFTFIILILPFEIRELYTSKAKTPQQVALFTFLFDVTYELTNVNYGINFYLYLISGTKFRRDLLNLLGIRSRLDGRTTVQSARSNDLNTWSFTRWKKDGNGHVLSVVFFVFRIKNLRD